MNLGAFENAIQAAVVAATGLPGTRVIWANQTRARPARPFISLELQESETWANLPEETLAATTVMGLPSVIINTIDHTEVKLQVLAFSADVTGSSRAFNLLQAVRRHFGKEATTFTLDGLAEPIAVAARGVVRDATVVLETEYEGRAVLDLTMRIADLDSETIEAIKSTEIETTVEQTSGNIIRTITVTAP